MFKTLEIEHLIEALKRFVFVAAFAVAVALDLLRHSYNDRRV